MPGHVARVGRYRENGQEHPGGAPKPSRTVPRGTNEPGGLNPEDGALAWTPPRP